MLLPVFAVCGSQGGVSRCKGKAARRFAPRRRGCRYAAGTKLSVSIPQSACRLPAPFTQGGQGRIQAAVFGLCRAQRVGRCRGDKTRVGILVYITHICIRHILSVERRRDIAVCFEKLYLSTVIIGLCQQKTRAIRQKSHCSSILDMVKYPRKTGETSDLAES